RCRSAPFRRTQCVLVGSCGALGQRCPTKKGERAPAGTRSFPITRMAAIVESVRDRGGPANLGGPESGGACRYQNTFARRSIDTPAKPRRDSTCPASCSCRKPAPTRVFHA